MQHDYKKKKKKKGCNMSSYTRLTTKFLMKSSLYSVSTITSLSKLYPYTYHMIIGSKLNYYYYYMFTTCRQVDTTRIEGYCTIQFFLGLRFENLKG